MDNIADIRSFNRTVTRHIGALENDFLGRGRSLGASRLLFEIGSKGVEIRELRSRLGLDSGYTSRLLRTLEREGLIQVGKSKKDTRVSFAMLTNKGRNEVKKMNSLSDRAAENLIEPLNNKQQSALINAMNTVQRLLNASSVVLEIESPTSQAAKNCLENYYYELNQRFDAGFDLGACVPLTPQQLTPPNGYFIVAKLYGKPIGCGGLKCHPDYGEIKRMWVAAESRGLGIGKRILSKLERLAQQSNLPVVRLDTNKSLTEAKALYRSSGYIEIPDFNAEPHAHHWFEKKLAKI